MNTLFQPKKLIIPLLASGILISGCASKKPLTTDTATIIPTTTNESTPNQQTFALKTANPLQGIQLGADGQPILDAHGNFIPLDPANKGFLVDENGNVVRDASGNPIALSSAFAAQVGLLNIRTFNFDYDTAAINPNSFSTLAAHANYLLKNAAAKIRLLGNTDERGTAEYNIALGERRAKAVEDYLVINGAKSSQIETVSYGEEKPLDDGHDEAAWAKNRRVEMKYDAMPPKP